MAQSMMNMNEEEKDYTLSEDLYDMMSAEATFEDPVATENLPKELLMHMKKPIRNQTGTEF